MKRLAILLLGLVYGSNSLAADIFIGVEEEPDACAVKKHLAYGPEIVELTGEVVEKNIMARQTTEKLRKKIELRAR